MAPTGPGGGNFGTTERGGNFDPPARAPQPQTYNACNGLCFGCGAKWRAEGKHCNKCWAHPDKNREDRPFFGSKPHQVQVESGKHSYPNVLNMSYRANGDAFTEAELQALANAKNARVADNQPNPAGRRRGNHPRDDGAESNQQPNQRPWSNHSQQQHSAPYNQNRYSSQGGRGRGNAPPPRSHYVNNNTYVPPARGPDVGSGQGETLVAIHANDSVTLPSVILHTTINELTVSCLFDSGALQGNYIGQALADYLRRKGEVLLESDGRTRTISLAGTSLSVISAGVLVFDVIFVNEITDKKETLFNVEASILDSQFQLIIGLPLIRAHGLAHKVTSFFGGAHATPTAMVDVSTITPPVHTDSDPSSAASNGRLWTESERWRQLMGDVQHAPRNRHSLSLLNVIKSKEELLPDCVADLDQVEWPDNPFDAGPHLSGDSSGIEKITIEGPLSTQRKIRDLCKRFEDIFSEHVRDEPAAVPPMEIKVNKTLWQTNRNRGPPRNQSNTKAVEIEKQIKKYLDLGVIKPIDASEYSNIHLVPKPDHAWRFCLDFVQLNNCTEGTDGWPIPNIAAMLNRIGSRKSTIFGVMDMTSGYHQAPISPASQIFTAFICFMGVFCWLRVPMGLKNAASYFQHVMATVVLAGIIYRACELYIDDIFVFGKNDDEFLSNLEAVFTRLRKHKVTLNPKKCRFGLASVEYVGHVVTADGISFSEEKREKVLDFPLPRTQKELQAFLGLINYFREHVPNMTELEKPLRELMDTSAKKNFTLTWNQRAEEQYYAAQDIVSRCPKLFFVNEHATIVVMTDASDYGVGAYIYQIIDGKEYPIIFFSRALHGAELNWATIEKEAYAIFLTLTKFQHLLRDNKFLLRTDHKNLTYVNLGGSQKIRRWGIALQEFDFDIEHVPGKDNIIADAFSRLCVNNSPVKIKTVILSSIPTIFPFRIPDIHYKSISDAHNSEVGHFGVEKTLTHLYKRVGKWVGMRRHVRQFIQQCPCCQLLREIKPVINTHPFVTASYTPMDVLNIDTIGPLAEDEDGNQHIIVVIDCFTRWVELYAVPDTSAKSAASALLQHVGRYGVPATLRSDQGSQFVNGIISELCNLLLMEHETTVAYSKEENAIVERANKEVMRHLRAIIFHQRVQAFWGKNQLPLVMRILNSEEKTNTGLSPAEILFGNTVDLGRRILHAPISKSRDGSETLTEYMDNMLKQQETLIKVAQETQLKHDTHHLSVFDPAFTEYPINSYVLLSPPAGDRPKLQMRKKGPYQVVNFIGSKYVLLDLTSGKNIETHISNLSPFLYDDTRVDPTDVAMHDEQEFLIENILSHRGDRTRRSTMEFLVQWQGFAASYNSWEPYANLRNTAKLSEYLVANRLKSILPKP